MMRTTRSRPQAAKTSLNSLSLHSSNQNLSNQQQQQQLPLPSLPHSLGYEKKNNNKY